MASLLFEDITVLDERGNAQEHQLVGVKDGRIALMCGVDDLQGAEREQAVAGYEERYDGRGKMLMPGLYNAHAHVPMTLLRGRGEGLPLDRWLNESIFPFEAHITDEHAYHATTLGIAEMLRFGTVSFSDMYYNSDARAKAILESGIKCNLGHSVLNFVPGLGYADLETKAVNDRLFERYHGAGDGRLLFDLNLHAEYTSNPEVVRGLAQDALEKGVRMQVHVSETASEVQGSIERHGMTPVAYLADCGLFDVPTTAAHCVHLQADDFAILRDKGVFVATCPASNAKLGSGVADVMGMREAGITVCLGTDGVASNNNHNMFQDIYLLGLMQRAKDQTPLGLSSGDLIEIATRNGALSQGRTDCGALALGNKADLVVLSCDTPWMQPVQTFGGNLVYSAQGSDVVLTMVDGKVLYRDGEYTTIDIERALFETNAAREAILGKMAE